jgi:hypothetical protein
MKIIIALLAVFALAACGGTWSGVKSDTVALKADVTPAPAPVDPVEAQSLLDKLENVDGPAAIARAQAEVANPKTPPAEVIYAQKRVLCYQAIMEIAPNFRLLNLPSIKGSGAGVLDDFEIVAETAEGTLTALKIGVTDVDRAKFETSCGWIGQRSRVIIGTMNLRAASALLPK